MFALGSVAGFAGNDHVPALLFLLHHIGVAGLAGIVSGKGHWPRSGLRDGSSAIVAVLSETMRDDRCAQGHKYDQQDHDDHSEPNQVFCVLEHFPLPRARRWARPARKMRNVLRYLRLEATTMIEVTGVCDRGHDAVQKGGAGNGFALLIYRLPKLLNLRTSC